MKKPHIKNLWQYMNAKALPVIGFAFFTIVNILIALPWVPRFDHELKHTEIFMTMSGRGADSWGPMQDALDMMNQSSGTSIYEKILNNKKSLFIYPPSALLFIDPLNSINTRTVAAFKDLSLKKVLNVISWAITAGMIFVCLVISYAVLKECGFIHTSFTSPALVIMMFLLCVLAVTYYPVTKAYTLGQIQVWINAAIAVAIFSLIKQKKAISGTIIGLVCLIKPQYVLLLLWGAVRRRWRFVVPLCSVLVCGTFVSILCYGLSSHLDYLQVMATISRHGEAFFPNQSINGLLNRLFFNGDILHWQNDAYVPFHPFVYAGTLISSLLFITGALLVPPAAGRYTVACDFSIMLIAITITSPIAWEHHFGVLLPVYALAFPLVLFRPGFGKSAVLVMAVSYILTSHFFVSTIRFAYTPINILMSYTLAGSLLLLILLVRICVQKEKEE